MNRQQRTGLVALAGAFISGAGVGAAVVRTWLEKGMRTAYAEREELMKNAYEQALELHFADKAEQPEAEAEPMEPEERLVAVAAVEALAATEEEKVTVNPYHVAVDAATSVEAFVAGTENPHGISYIEDEDYQDEGDGYFKGRIDILMADTPVFMMDGQICEDWEKRIGSSILLDFFNLVPPGLEPVLYVRNHRTGEDYEVVQVLP